MNTDGSSGAKYSAGYFIPLFIYLAVLRTSIYQYTTVYSDKKDF